MSIEFDEGYDGNGESYKELRRRARSLLKNCHEDNFGKPPVPSGWKEEAPLYIDQLLGEVINLKNQTTADGETVDDDTLAEDIRWPRGIAEKHDSPVYLFGFKTRGSATEADSRTEAENANLDKKEVVTDEILPPILAKLPGTPQGLVDMYEAYVRGITDLEEYWEGTWDDLDFEDTMDDVNEVEKLDLEEIKQITKEVAKEISDELTLGEKGTMSIRDLQTMVSDLDDAFDENVVKEEELHEKIDRLGNIKFTEWLRKIPPGPATHFDKITKAVTKFPFSPNSAVRGNLLQAVRKKARINARRFKMNRSK